MSDNDCFRDDQVGTVYRDCVTNDRALARTRLMAVHLYNYMFAARPTPSAELYSVLSVMDWTWAQCKERGVTAELLAEEELLDPSEWIDDESALELLELADYLRRRSFSLIEYEEGAPWFDQLTMPPPSTVMSSPLLA